MHDHLKVIGDVLCIACNRGWSARLEELAKPLLLPMMRNEGRVTLDGDAQRVVATWLNKTTQLLGYVAGDGTESAAAAATRMAKDEQRPDDETAIWLARFAANPLLRHAWWRKDLTAGGKRSAELYIVTLDTLAAVVLIRKSGTREDWNLSERNKRFVRIWPQLELVAWPPERDVTVEELHGLPQGPVPPPPAAGIRGAVTTRH